MELNTEINKVFGQEMAKLFAATIDEEELVSQAKEVWNQMNKRENEWGHVSDSEIQKYIKSEILDKLHNKINELLKQPVNEELLETKAREMIERARKIGEEAIIQDMARHMADNALSVYNVREEIVASVMRELEIQKSRY